MAFEHWNKFLQDYLKQKENKQPPPQNNNGSSKEVNRIEQKQIQKVSRKEI